MDNEEINVNTAPENAGTAAKGAEDLPPEAVGNKAPKIMGFVYDTVSIFVSAVVVIMLLFSFAFRIVGVRGTSMVDTLQNNDWLVVTPYYTEPKATDIVIITQPNFFNEPLVKRIIATEGEEVFIDHDTGIVYVDGMPLEEPYTHTLTTEYVQDEYEWPVVVPEGCVFCMGDNRNGSTDSRSKLVGMIDKNYLLGKAQFRFLPLKESKNIYATTPKEADIAADPNAVK